MDGPNSNEDDNDSKTDLIGFILKLSFLTTSQNTVNWYSSDGVSQLRWDDMLSTQLRCIRNEKSLTTLKLMNTQREIDLYRKRTQRLRDILDEKNRTAQLPYEVRFNDLKNLCGYLKIQQLQKEQTLKEVLQQKQTMSRIYQQRIQITIVKFAEATSRNFSVENRLKELKELKKQLSDKKITEEACGPNSQQFLSTLRKKDDIFPSLLNEHDVSAKLIKLSLSDLASMRSTSKFSSGTLNHDYKPTITSKKKKCINNELKSGKDFLHISGPVLPIVEVFKKPEQPKIKKSTSNKQITANGCQSYVSSTKEALVKEVDIFKKPMPKKKRIDNDNEQIISDYFHDANPRADNLQKSENSVSGKNQCFSSVHTSATDFDTNVSEEFFQQTEFQEIVSYELTPNALSDLEWNKKNPTIVAKEQINNVNIGKNATEIAGNEVPIIDNIPKRAPNVAHNITMKSPPVISKVPTSGPVIANKEPTSCPVVANIHTTEPIGSSSTDMEFMEFSPPSSLAGGPMNASDRDFMRGPQSFQSLFSDNLISSPPKDLDNNPFNFQFGTSNTKKSINEFKLF